MSRKVPHIMHGYSGHKIYHTFLSIHERCLNKEYKQYYDYGGRGIKICDEWNRNIVGTKQAIENFIADMYSSFSDGLSIDRIDVNGNYEPSNCRWATRQEQSDNARSVRTVQQLDCSGNVINEYKSCHEAGRVTNIPYQNIRCCCHKKPKYNTAGGYRWKFK